MRHRRVLKKAAGFQAVLSILVIGSGLLLDMLWLSALGLVQLAASLTGAAPAIDEREREEEEETKQDRRAA
jgi:hypothetical protein